jgi:hypothetical protein
VTRQKTTLPYNPVADRMRSVITGSNGAGSAEQDEEAKPVKPTYLRASFQIPSALLDEVRVAVIALSGPPSA